MNSRDADRPLDVEITQTNSAQAETAEPNRVLEDLDRLAGVACLGCARHICGHEAIFSVVMGLKNAPRCLACLAKGLEQPSGELGKRLLNYVHSRDCYHEAWDVASGRERSSATDGQCPWLEPTSPDESNRQTRALRTQPQQSDPSEAHSREPLAEPSVEASWDAGDMGCGDLVLELRGRLLGMAPGAVLEVFAHDRGAPEDLPAWCRLTGHRMLRAIHPRYLIQRKEP